MTDDSNALHPAKAQLEHLIDGRLAPEDETKLALHLAGCAECKILFDGLANATAALGSSSAPTAEFTGPNPQGDRNQTTNIGPDAPTCPAPPFDEPDLPFLTAAANPAHLGQLGPYEVTSVIGQGGMGVVLKARDPRLNRFVAIKVLAPQLAASSTARKRFAREAQAAAAVTHDRIVTIHAVDEVCGFPYLVMEYVVGDSLAGRLARSGPLGVKETLRIAMQVAAGLAAAHAHGLVHRDIKPANILLESGGERVKITDFGLARAAGDVQVTHTGQVAGTPEFMSPEQARGGPLDHRSDLFSLGCVLYAMCADRSPFRAPTVPDAIMRVCHEQPQSLREVDPQVDQRLIAIIDKLLAKSPDERFQSAAEVADLLGQYLASLQEPTSASPPPRLAAKQPRAPRRRKPWLMAVAVVLSIGALGLTEAAGVTQLAATLIRVIRPEGTLEIHVDDPAVQVTVDGKRIGIQGAGPHEIRLCLGEHELQAIKDGKPVHRELLSITRGGREIVKVGMAPAEAEPEQKSWEPFLGDAKEWIDVLAKVDLARDRVSGSWQLNGSAIENTDTKSSERVLLPMRIDGDYDLLVECTRVAGKGGVPIVFPVGPRNCLFICDDDQCLLESGFDSASVKFREPTIRRGTFLVSGKRTGFLIRVRTAGTAANIDVFRNGTLLTRWEGDAKALGVNGYWNPPASYRIMLSPNWSRLQFVSVRLKMVSGTARAIDEASAGETQTFAHKDVWEYGSPEGPGTFEHIGQGTWIEFRPNGARETFREAEHTSDYLELFDPSRGGVTVRLHETGSEWKHAELTQGDWAWLWPGRWLNEPVPPESIPPFGVALQFDGPGETGGHVGLPGLNLDNDGPYTIELFAWPKSLRGGGGLLCLNGDGRLLRIIRWQGFWHGTWWSAETGSLQYLLAPVASLRSPTHLALCWDGRSATFFVNGARVESGPSPFPRPRPIPKPGVIGADLEHAGDLEGFFVGQIAEIRVSKSTRYRESFTPARRFEPDADTLALYHCDECQGDVLNDSSGNQHHGKLNDVTWFRAGRAANRARDSKTR